MYILSWPKNVNVFDQIWIIFYLYHVSIQPDDLETSPVRAPPTEAPIFEAETDDEDLEESSGLDIDNTDAKGKGLFN